MKKLEKYHLVKEDMIISTLKAIGNYLDSLPKSVIKRFRENVKKYAGMSGKDYNDFWEGIEKYKY